MGVLYLDFVKDEKEALDLDDDLFLKQTKINNFFIQIIQYCLNQAPMPSETETVKMLGFD